MPREANGRPFGLIDLHVMIAATALGLGVSRWAFEVLVLRRNRLSYPGTSWPLAASLISLMTPILLFWSLGMIVLRWRGPAGPRRRVFRETGFVASLGAWIGLGVFLLVTYPAVLSWAPRRVRDPWGALPNLVAMSILGGWLVLWLQGRWRPAAHWMDRVGRLLGYAWVVLFLLGWLRFV